MIKESKPNILIFMPDEMRGEVITNPSIQMPNVRSLAQEGGVIFTNNFAVNPVCVPSRICTFTGQYPHNGGHRSLYQLLRPGEENLFHILKEAGYKVILIGRNDLFHKNTIKQSISKRKCSIMSYVIKLITQGIRKFGLIRMLKMIRKLRKLDGLEKYSEKPEFEFIVSRLVGTNPHPKNSKWYNSFYFGIIPEVIAKSSHDEEIVKHATKYLKKYARSRYIRKKPFCLVVSINNPHPPYQVEEPYFSMYKRNEIQTPYPFIFPDIEDRNNKALYARTMHEIYRLDEFTEEEFREILAVYYGMCTKVDYLFGKILHTLKETGLYESTMINFFADHGDYAGAYGLIEKWPTGMEDALLHVPLVMKIPTLDAALSKIDVLTETIDIFPTILQIAGIEHPYTHFGKSLIPVVNGEETLHREEVHAEGGYDPREPQAFEDVPAPIDDPLMDIYYLKTNIQEKIPKSVCRTTMWRTRAWKLILRSHPDAVNELYHLTTDPEELKNLYQDPKFRDIIKNIKEDILHWYIASSDNPHYFHQREP